jgi:hypothetical protein
VTSNFIRGQAMPDNLTLIWLQAANFNILLVEAILLRGVPIRGFEAKVYRDWQHRSCTPFTARPENFDAQLGTPTIRRNVYIPQSENVGGGPLPEGLLLVNLRVFSNLPDSEKCLIPYIL